MTNGDPIKDLVWVIASLDDRSRKAVKVARQYGELHDDLALVYEMWKEDPGPVTPIITSGSPHLAITQARRDLESSQSPETWAQPLSNLEATIKLVSSVTVSGYALTSTLSQEKTSDLGVTETSDNPAYVRLRNRIERTERRPDVQALLDEFDKSIADMYRAAWESWSLRTADPTRGPLFLMREVLTQTLDALSKAGPGRETETRRQKAQWIARTLARSGEHTQLLEEATADALCAYDDLCVAHKRGRLQVREAEVWMYQADDYLYLLLHAIDLDRWRGLLG